MQSVDELRAFLQRGNPGAGMPAFGELPATDLTTLANYLKSLNEGMSVPKAADSPAKIHWRPPQPGDWITYNGDYFANRYSRLQQITAANVGALKLKWIYPTAHFGLETTPLASDGVLYFTGPNQVIAVDALTGSDLWNYSRAMTPGMNGDAKLGTNRGVALWTRKCFS